MGNNPSSLKGDDLPVESVTWYEAVAYANKLSVRDGLTPVYTISPTGENLESGEGPRLLKNRIAWGSVGCDWGANGVASAFRSGMGVRRAGRFAVEGIPVRGIGRRECGGLDHGAQRIGAL